MPQTVDSFSETSEIAEIAGDFRLTFRRIKSLCLPAASPDPHDAFPVRTGPEPLCSHTHFFNL